MKKRTSQPRAVSPRVPETAGGFVELDPRQFFDPFAAGPVIDVCSRGGDRLTVLLAGQNHLDVPALIAAFLGQRP